MSRPRFRSCARIEAFKRPRVLGAHRIPEESTPHPVRLVTVGSLDPLAMIHIHRCILHCGYRASGLRDAVGLEPTFRGGDLLVMIWSTPGQGADRTKRYQTELPRQPEHPLNGEDAGQSVVRAFLDTEEVRGSNPLAPTTKGPGHRAFSVARSRPDRGFGAEKLTKS